MKCPNCACEKVLEIVYGKPPSDILEAADRGEVILGGCVISKDSPKMQCSFCGYKWIPKISMICFKCKSDQVIPIVWTGCSRNPNQIKDEDDGKIILKGGIILPKLEDRKNWHCKNCNVEW